MPCHVLQLKFSGEDLMISLIFNIFYKLHTTSRQKSGVRVSLIILPSIRNFRAYFEQNYQAQNLNLTPKTHLKLNNPTKQDQKKHQLINLL